MTCPKCGRKQWNLDESTLTCKAGHRFGVGEKPKRFEPTFVIPVTVASTVALDLLIRQLT